MQTLNPATQHPGAYCPNINMISYNLNIYFSLLWLKEGQKHSSEWSSPVVNMLIVEDSGGNCKAPEELFARASALLEQPLVHTQVCRVSKFPSVFQVTGTPGSLGPSLRHHGLFKGWNFVQTSSTPHNYSSLTFGNEKSQANGSAGKISLLHR